MVRRYELSDREWECVEPLLERPRPRGRPPKDHRQMLNAILWVVRTGAPWRDLPERYGPWQSVYDRFVRWQADGVWERVTSVLAEQPLAAAWEEPSASRAVAESVPAVRGR